MTKLIIAVVGGTLLAASALILGPSYLNGSKGASGGAIEIIPQEYDAGTVSMALGPVKKTYEIKNKGEEDLVISEIRTSCDCTSAKFTSEGKESPKFGMHDGPSLWSQKITPGQSGFLEVTFDPAFHGHEGMGNIVRAVYFSTSDPQNKKAEVRLIANVIN